MKKILILIAFLFSFNSLSSQKVLCHPMGSEKECLYAYLALIEYVEDTNVAVFFNTIEPLHPAFNGITWQYSKYLYQVSINVAQRNPAERLWTVFHEIGHVIDMYDGKLSQFPIRWKDKIIKEDVPWEERPWEQSAEKWAYRLWRKFINDNPPYNPKLNMIHREHDCIIH